MVSISGEDKENLLLHIREQGTKVIACANAAGITLPPMVGQWFNPEWSKGKYPTHSMECQKKGGQTNNCLDDTTLY